MKLVFDQNPAVCTPLTGSTAEQILQECKLIMSKGSDIMEWRADFFEEIHDPKAVIHVLSQLSELLDQVPVLFTVRSVREGGNPSVDSSEELIQLYRSVCESRYARYIDFELSNTEEDILQVRELCNKNELKLILSFHNFNETPGEEVLREKFERTKKLGGDIVKVAVMPNTPEEALTFMKDCYLLQQEYDLPMISISMGPLGMISRLAGWLYGSQMTFAVGENSSAPGQLPVENVRKVIDIMKKSLSI